MYFSRFIIPTLVSLAAFVSASPTSYDGSLDLRDLEFESDLALRALPVSFHHEGLTDEVENKRISDHAYHPRAVHTITYKPKVFGKTTAAERQQIEADIHTHVASFPANHAIHTADSAHVWKGPHTKGSTDPHLHSTVDFYNGNQHVTTHHVYHRRNLNITYKPKVYNSLTSAQRAQIEADIHAHHAALPANHAAKGADTAHVWKAPHTSSDPNLHSTVDFKANGQHITTHHVYHRRNLNITYKPKVYNSLTSAQRTQIEADIHAHHAALPANHAAKGADTAHVWKAPHTSSDPRLHSTVDFKANGQHITTHHVYHRRTLNITYKPKVYNSLTSAQRTQIEADIHAHHAALPANHAAKNADTAHVWKAPHTSSDPNLHSTVDFKANGQHITTHHVYHRRTLNVTYKPSVLAKTTAAQRQQIEADVRAHHAALPANHAAKNADTAHVWKEPHTSSDPRLHSTVDFKANGQHITTHHVVH